MADARQTTTGRIVVGASFLQFHAGCWKHFLMYLGGHIREALRLEGDGVKLYGAKSEINEPFLARYRTVYEVVERLASGASATHANVASVLEAAFYQFNQVGVDAERELNGYAVRDLPPVPGPSHEPPPPQPPAPGIPEPAVSWRKRQNVFDAEWDADGFYSEVQWKNPIPGFDEIPDVTPLEGVEFVSGRNYQNRSYIRSDLRSYSSQIIEVDQLRQGKLEEIERIGRNIPGYSLLYSLLDTILSTVKPFIVQLTDDDYDFPQNGLHDSRLWVYGRLCVVDMADWIRTLLYDSDDYRPTSAWHSMVRHPVTGDDMYTGLLNEEYTAARVAFKPLFDAVLTSLWRLPGTFATFLAALHNLAAQFVIFIKVFFDIHESLVAQGAGAAASGNPYLGGYSIFKYALGWEALFAGLEQLKMTFVTAWRNHYLALEVVRSLSAELERTAPEFDPNLRDRVHPFQWLDPTQDVYFPQLINGRVYTWSGIVDQFRHEQRSPNFDMKPGILENLSPEQLQQIADRQYGTEMRAAAQTLLAHRTTSMSDRVAGPGPEEIDIIYADQPWSPGPGWPPPDPPLPPPPEFLDAPDPEPMPAEPEP